MSVNRTITVAIAAIVAIAAGVLLSREQSRREGAPIAVLTQGTLIAPARPLPAFALVDQNAAPFGAERLKDRWTYVFFGFTHCPDVCPATLAVLSQVEQSLADLQPALRPQILFVSVDPQRDTPARLAQYVRTFGPSVVGVSGEQSQIDALTRHMSVPVAVRDGDEGNYAVNHSGAIFLVDPNGALRALFSTPHSATGLAEDYRRLVVRADS